MYALKLLNLITLFCFILSNVFGSSGLRYEFDYIVIGAGPAGLQFGYFLKTAGRDYIVLEKANISGIQCKTSF